jgi:hypothetical protein
VPLDDRLGDRHHVWVGLAFWLGAEFRRAALTRCLTIAQRDALGLPVLPGAGRDRDHIDPPPCP